MPSDRSDTSNPIPIYRKIEENMRRKVTAGFWTPGTMLPSRRALCGEYGVSLPTLEQAIKSLLNDGTLVADKRRGTFVPHPGQSVGSSPLPSQQNLSDRSITGEVLPSAAPVVSILLDETELNDWHISILRAFEHRIAEAGGETVLLKDVYLEANPTRDLVIDTMSRNGSNALAIVNLSRRDEFVPTVGALDPISFPIVCLGSSDLAFLHPSVYSDQHEVGFNAANHLMQRGCRNILFFSPFQESWVSERMEGARRAMRLGERSSKQFLTAVTSINVIREHENIQKELACKLAQEIVSKDSLPDGVIAANDHVALGFMQAAEERGLVAGVHYAIIGFDDIPLARQNGLTSMRPPVNEVGSEGAELIIRLLQGRAARMNICLHSQLITRSSSRMPAS